MLCFMASHLYPLGLAPIQEQGFSRAVKDCEALFPTPVIGKEIVRSSLSLKPCRWEEPWKTIDGTESKLFVNIDSAVRRPAVIEAQDIRPHAFLSSSSIGSPSIRHEKDMQFLLAEPHKSENGVIDISFLSDIMRLETMRNHVSRHSSAPFLNHSESGLHSQKQLLDFVGDLARSSKITIQQDGHVLFSGTQTEMKDLVSFVAEFYLSNNSAKWSTQSVLIPHFDRLGASEAWVNVEQSSLMVGAIEVAPLKSPEKVKRKQSTKRKNSRKAGAERDLYKRNYFHACESFLSLMLDKSRSGRMTILSLRKSGPELSELLTQFSAGIAGTGLAVLFSVIYKVASGRVPLCASKLLNTGFGFGLVWLAWAVNRLRDIVIGISRSAGKLDLKEDEIVRRVHKSVNEIFFRAATVMAVALLRFA